MKKLTLILSIFCVSVLNNAQGQSGFLIGGELQSSYSTSSRFNFFSASMNLNLGYQIGTQHQFGIKTTLVSSDSDFVEDEFRFNGVYYNYLYWLNNKIAVSTGLDFAIDNNLGNALDINGGLLMRLSPNIDMTLGILNGPIWTNFDNELSPSPTIIDPNPSGDYILTRRESTSLGLLNLFNNLKINYRLPKWKNGFEDNNDFYPRRFVSASGNFSNNTSYFQNVNDPDDQLIKNSEFQSFELNAGLFTVGKYLIGAKIAYLGNSNDSFESQKLTLAALVRRNNPLSKNIGFYGQFFAGPTLGLSDSDSSGFEGGLEGGLIFNVYKSLSLEMNLLDFGFSYNSTFEIVQFNALIIQTDNLLGINFSF